MNYQAIIAIAQYAFSALFLFLFFFRWARIWAFNRSVEEPVPFRAVSFYNTIEVDGTDVPIRRYFMRRMNKLMSLTIFVLMITIAIYLLPAVLQKFGIK